MNQVSPAAASAFESRYPEAKFGDHLEAVRDQVAVTLPGPGERFALRLLGNRRISKCAAGGPQRRYRAKVHRDS